MEEVLSEGKNFKLVKEEELPEIVDILEQHLPESIKVGTFFRIFAYIICKGNESETGGQSSISTLNSNNK